MLRIKRLNFFSKPTKRMKLRLDWENQNIQKSKEQKSNSKNRFSKWIMNDKNSIQRKVRNIIIIK